MRLCKFEVRNFKGIEYVSLDWENIIVLIGENNAGKSTVLQALQVFLSGSQIKDEALFRDKVSSAENAIELIGHFNQLTDGEKEATAVRGRMHGDKWIIKKEFWFDTGDDKWKEQYWSYSTEEKFTDWPEKDSSWANFPDSYTTLVDKVKETHKKSSQKGREALKELVRQEKPDLIGSSVPAWIKNPGGGGTWKSNANSIMPQCIPIRAVHDATEESISKEASTYGKLLSLIVEKKMLKRTEVIELQEKLKEVLALFKPGEDQAPEIKDLQDRINERLNQVIGGIATIETEEPEVKPFILPSTTLVLRDREDSIPTPVKEQGHGLQRTLIMSLMQLLVEVQAEPGDEDEGVEERVARIRPVILTIEEPELYMHPQMERKMRDTLYRLSEQSNTQVICSTHSPVFIDLSKSHRAIVRLCKDENRKINLAQAKDELFTGEDDQSLKDRLNLITNFDPMVNEVFFAKRVVLLEERTAHWAFEGAAEITGIFQRFPQIRRDTTLICADGKKNVPVFQRVLNHFDIPYLVVADYDDGKPAQADNPEIEQLAENHMFYFIKPINIESMLQYQAVERESKPFQAVKKVKELHAGSGLPQEFIKAMNMIYFGNETEPAVEE